MKICHISSAHKWNDGRILLKECLSLQRMGFDVTLVIPDASEQEYQGVKILSGFSKSDSRLGRLVMTTYRAVKLALTVKADVYQIHDPELLWAMVLLKPKGARIVYDAHEDLPRQVLNMRWLPIYLRKFVSSLTDFFESALVRKFDGVVGATPLISARFSRYCKHVCNICNYPLLAEFPASTPWSLRQRRICYVGGVTEIRGIFQLLDAIQELDVELAIAGEIHTPLITRVESHPAWKKVKYHGYLGREAVAKLYAESKIGMVTLHPTKNHLDSMPIKLFEYMASGLPVIASDFPLWRSFVLDEQAGLVVDPMDVKAIQKAMETILNDDLLASSMGKNGREAVLSRYNWEAQMSDMDQFYKAL